LRAAIIGGTGVYGMPGGRFDTRVIETPYGEALVFLGQGEFEDLIFLARHGPSHAIPPHRINFRANLKALEQLGVKRVLATFAVGSLQPTIPPGSLVAVDQFIDFTHGRVGTFYDGGESGLVHTDMTEPYCSALRERLLALADQRGLQIRPTGTYMCFNGPRFETAAEIRMYAQLGGDVVGMTGAPEVQLARELRMHYAAVAISINWAAGLKGPIKIEKSGMEQTREKLLHLLVEVLRAPLVASCHCETALMIQHPPTNAG